jgi:DegV family protein with EDD domain
MRRARLKTLVDSTAGISPSLAERWGVGVVPLYVTWEGRTFRDGLDLSPADFYAQLAGSATNPATAAPNPADFESACRSAFAEGYDQVLIVTASAQLSATYDHARLAAREFSDDAVAVLDCRQGAGAQALIAAYAAALARTGTTLAEAVPAVEAACRSTNLLMAVSTLTFLHRSGRLSRTRALMGDLLGMKPILTFQDGRLTVVAKPRSTRRAIDSLLASVEHEPASIAHVLVMYADAVEPAEELRAAVQARLPDIPVDASPVSAVVGGHSGPGLLGLALRRVASGEKPPGSGNRAPLR